MKNPNPVKAGPPNRKAALRLARRIYDYSRMIEDKDFKAPQGAYHRPGSMQGPR